MKDMHNAGSFGVGRGNLGVGGDAGIGGGRAGVGVGGVRAVAGVGLGGVGAPGVGVGGVGRAGVGVAGVAGVGGFTPVSASARYATAAAVRTDYGHWGLYGRDWYGRYPGAWAATGWAAGNAWRMCVGRRGRLLWLRQYDADVL